MPWMTALPCSNVASLFVNWTNDPTLVISIDLIMVRPHSARRRPYVWKVRRVVFNQHNIEFSCRPESARYATVRWTAFTVDRPHPGGQLQRFVMTTIRVMAWPIRAKLTAHGEKRLLAKASRYHSASCVATSINAHQPN